MADWGLSLSLVTRWSRVAEMVSATIPSWRCAAADWVSPSWSIQGSDPGLGAFSATPCAKPCPLNTGQVDSVEMNENPGQFHPCQEIPRILGNDVKNQQYPGDSQQALTAYFSTLVWRHHLALLFLPLSYKLLFQMAL